MTNCKCSNCGCEENFDAKSAYEILNRKYTDLADIMMQYMSEANLKRSIRAENAMGMAAAAATIVGGEPTSEFPDCCAVLGTGLCSGILIHERVVLTAAHCNNSLRVRLNTTNSNSGGEVITVLRNRRHPDYNPSTSFFDIRVLILQNPANTRSVGMATRQEFLNSGQTTLVGFGQDDFGSSGQKRCVHVDIDHNANIDFFDPDREFVAGGDGQDTCYGDSGGPAYINANGIWKVAGLTSRGINNNCGDGGIYSRVDAHLDFIREVAGQSGITL